MASFPHDEQRLTAPQSPAHRELAIWHARWRRTATTTFAVGSAGVVFLCFSGLKPAALAIPVFFAVISLMLAAGSAALFARVTYLQFEDVEPGPDEEGGGGWGGPGPSPDPSGGGGPQFDWQRFEREFRSYCERVPASVS